MSLFKTIKTMAKTFFHPSLWSSPILGGGGLFSSSVFDSVWTIAGVEDKAQTVSSLPILFVGPDDKPIKRMTTEQKQWAYVLMNPDAMVLGSQLWELTTMLYEIDGMAYWVLYDEYGSPIQNPLDIPQRILAFGKNSLQPQYDPTNATRVIGWMLTEFGMTMSLRPHQVVRFWRANPRSYREGLSMMDKVGGTMSLDKAARRTNSNFFINGARPSGYLKVVERVGEDQAEKFAADFRNRFSNPSNAGKIPLIPREFDFKPDDGIKDMDFVNLHKSNRDEFFASHRVPKHHLGVNDDLNYATAEIVDRSYYLNVIQPIVTVFQSVVNGRMLLGTGMRIKFSFEDIPAIQIERLRVTEQETKNLREKWRIASYMWKLGYPQNWINEYLDLGAQEMKESWAKVPHDPSAQPASNQPSNSDANSNKMVKVNIDYSKAIDAVLKKKSINDAAEEGDIDAMDVFCKSVESSSIGALIPKFEKTIDSYFNRLEDSQITRIEAYLDGESYANKTEGDKELTEENIDKVLFSRLKWDEILLTDTQSQYIKAYRNSIAVVESELSGFASFSQTDTETIARAKQLQVKVVRINETVRNDIRDAISQALSAGGGRDEILESVKGAFRSAHARQATIARTEMGIAMNGARFDAISVEKKTKQWVSARDSHVRTSHRTFTAKGSVEMSYQYDTGLAYPQDPNCPEAGEVVNCRCVLVAGR